MNTQRISHIISTHIFIFATSLAMLVHSTWTFGTLFSGEQPTIDGTIDQWIAYLLWVAPALLVALAIDVGQIQTSVKLSNAKGRSQKVTLGVTFITLALAGYYLQWFHLAHHIPALEFGAGLSPDMRNSLEPLKALAIFIVPALLPLSTILYTLSSEAPEPTPQQITPNIDIRFPAIEHRIWSEESQNNIGNFDTEFDTEPVESVTTMPSEIHRPKSVTRPVVPTNLDKSCERCGKLMKDARPNRKYCNVVCRNNAHKARKQ